jgi:DNA replication protein DnaC
MKGYLSLEEERLARDEFLMQSFKKLRLPGMAACYQEILDGNERMDDVDVATLMERFVNAELVGRGDRKTSSMIGKACLWYPSADLCDLKGRNAMLGAQTVSTLSKCGFVNARAFAIIHGGPKSGTTYLGCAIAVSACRLRYKTRYIRYFDLLQNLIEAKSKDGLQEALDYYRSMDCLVVDDWMNTPMNHNELMLIREIMDYRPKYGGTILVSHTQPDDWASMMQTNASYKVSMIKTLTEGATVVNLG